MDYIEEILNLRELVTRLSNRVAALEKIEKREFITLDNGPLEYDHYLRPAENSCKKCGLELNQVMGYVCSRSDCPCGCGPSTCSSSSMTSEPCHGLDIKNIELVTGKQWGEFKSIDNNQSITLGGFNLEVGPDYKDSNSIGELNGIIAAFDSKSQVCRDERDKYNKETSELTQYWRDNPDKAPKY